MSDAKVELRVKKGIASIARGIRINGFEIPGVTRVSVDYNPNDVRRISLEIVPTDVIEIDDNDWDPQPEKESGGMDDIPF